MSTTPSFGPKLTPDLAKLLNLRDLDYQEEILIGIPPKGDSLVAMHLRPHEVAVIQWLRIALLRSSSTTSASNVGTLLVGEKGHADAVNHQFDFVDPAGITSVSDGVTIAHGEYDPHGMYPGEEYCRNWTIIATGLGDRCTDETDTVIAPCNPYAETLRTDQAGTLAAARHWFTNFPGHDVELVGGYFAARLLTSDPAAAEAFFSEFGEYTDEHEDIADAMTSSLAEGMTRIAAAAKRLDCKPQDLLEKFICSLDEGTRDPEAAPAGIAEATVPSFSETAPDGARAQIHPSSVSA